MNARRLHHLWTLIRPVKPRYFVVAGILMFGVAIFALRSNNLKMVELRDAVYMADREGGDVSAALTRLQRHVTSHMNTGLSGDNTVYPPIQLRYTYERLREANLKTSNEQLYVDAQRHCEALNSTDFSGRNRVPCIQEYVESRGVRQQQVPESLYKFDFVAPLWSPDMAGYSLLTSIILFVTAAAIWILRRFVKNKII